MSAKTERITILSTPEFKAFLSAEASKAGVSVAELVRSRCERPAANESADDQALLATFTQELKEATARANASLDKGMKKAEAILTKLEQRDCYAK